MKQFIKNIHIPLIGVGILLIGSVVVGTVFAWTNPSSNPPLGFPAITTTNGNVGIGATVPDVNYRITTSGGGIKAENSSAVQPAGYFNNTGGGPAITAGTGGITLGGVNQVAWPVSTSQWTTSGTNIYSSNTGNVGIGVTSPNTKLDVSGFAMLGGSAANLDSVSSIPGLKDSGKLLVGWNRTAALGETDFVSNRGAGSEGGFYFYDYSNGVVPSWNTLLVMKGSGNVGVGGTVNPLTKLHVKGGSVNWNETTQGMTLGSIHLDPGSSTDNFGSGITWGASDANAGLTAQAGIYTRSDGAYGTKMYFSTTDAYAVGAKTRLMIDSTGAVGIGTAAPDTNYKITTTAGGIKAENSSATQPAGYFNNAGGGPAITAGTGGITLGGVNKTTWAAPFQGALVYTSSPWPTLGAATFTTIPYAYEKYDTDAIHDTVTNPARLTVPAGVSRVRLVFKLAVGSTPTSAGSLSVQIKKNGTTNNTDSAEATFPLATTYRPSVMVSSPVTNVIPGDYFEAVVYNSTAALTGVVSWFGMEVIE